MPWQCPSVRVFRILCHHALRYQFETWHISGPLYTARHGFRCFSKHHVFGIFATIFAHFGFFEVFRAFFYMFLDINLKLGIYIYQVVGVTCQVRVSFQSGHLRLGAHIYIMSVLTPTNFRHVWAIVTPGQNTWKWELIELPVSEKFSGIFCTCFEIYTWNLVYTPSRQFHISCLIFITIRLL